MKAQVDAQLAQMRAQASRQQQAGTGQQNPRGGGNINFNPTINVTTPEQATAPPGSGALFGRDHYEPDGKKREMGPEERKSLDKASKYFMVFAFFLSFDFFVTLGAAYLARYGYPGIEQFISGIPFFEPFGGFQLPTDPATYWVWLSLTLAAPYFLGFFALRGIISLTRHEWKLGLFAIYIFAIHSIGLTMRSWSDLSGLLNEKWVILLIFVILAYFIGKRISPKVQAFTWDDIGYLTFALVFSFLFLNYGFWTQSIKAILHLSFVIAFGYLIIKRYEDNEFWFYIWMTVGIIADFFGYAIGTYFGITFVQFWPILFFLVVMYISTRAQITPISVISIILCLVVLFGGLAEARTDNTTNYAAPGTQQVDISKTSSAWSSMWSWFTGRINLATQQYTGQVEQNQYESLGVYFSNLKAAQPRFYTDEPVVVWGSIRSKTYQDAVIVNPSCYILKGGSFISSGTKSYGKMVPGQPFPIFQLEDTDIECSFLNHTFDAGTQTVMFSAEYNFVTNSYQKAYFMDRERYRAYIRQSIDPLTQFGIKDKMPKAVFTNGPVEIGMSVQALTAVADPNSYTVLPAISLTLSNRQQIEDKDKKVITRWEGKIRNIKELILLLPPGVTIPDPKSCTPVPFKAYTEADCRGACGSIGSTGDSTGGNGAHTGNDDTNDYGTCVKSCRGKDACTKECARILQSCNDECGFLFKGDSGEQATYTAYALDVSAIKLKDDYKDIDKFKTFQCRMQPAPNVLDNAPLTTRYFRVRAKYNYLLENSVQVVVEKSPIQVALGGQQPAVPVVETNGAYEASVAALAPMLNPADTATGIREREYDPYVRAAAQSQGIDYLLIKAITQAESQWDSNVQTYDSEDSDYSVGLMGVSVDIAKERGCVPEDMDQALARDMLKDPEKNINCGAAYLKYLLDIQKARQNMRPGIRNLMGGYYGSEDAMEDSSTVPESTGTATLTKVVPKWENEKNLGYAETRAYVNSVVTFYNQLRQKIGTQTTPQQAKQGTSISEISQQITFSLEYSAQSKQVTLAWSVPPSYAPDQYMGTVSLYYSVARSRNGAAEGGEICPDPATVAPASYKCVDTLPNPLPDETYTYTLSGTAISYNGNNVFATKQASVRIPPLPSPGGSGTQTEQQTQLA